MLRKKKNEKWPFFGLINGLTPLEKYQFFDFLIFWFLEARKAFFRSRIWSRRFSVLEYRKKYFPGLFCRKKQKFQKKDIFVQKPWINPFRIMAIFRVFELLF